ncbi:Iron-sulfur cluster repair protein YtfE [bacterium HR36]|nr:Iron-sulfur cluster repair protein YtfE [bacterium HR36]
MRTIQTLMHEHRIIEHGLAVLLELARRFQTGAAVAKENVIAVLDFFQRFADGCHHAKEEGMLFPELERCGLAREAGPIGVMMRDHEQGRQLLAQMRQALQQADRPENRHLFVQAALQYARLLREHIWKEDNVLFRLAERLLSENTDADMVERFEEFERDQIGEGTHERYHQLIHDLERELAIKQEDLAAVSPVPPANHCGCGHGEEYHRQAGLTEA